MATLSVKYGDEWHEIEAYKIDNNWYNAITHELIRKDFIFWIN